MTGFPTTVDPALGSPDNNTIDTNLIIRSQGITSQSLAALATSGGSVGNFSSVLPAGSPNLADARPGFLSAGQPGGNPADVVVPDTDGNGADGATIQTVSAPAGTAGGFGIYPNITGTDAVQNPFIAHGWTAQSSTGDEFDQMVITTPAALPAATHEVAYSETLTAVGGDGTNTWSLVAGYTLPSALTLSPAGVISGTPAAAGQSAFRVQVTDSHGNAADQAFTLTIS